MTPTTPTGKRLMEGLEYGAVNYADHDDILAIEREASAAERERYRYGWCCDFDFDNGTFRTTDCIGRTRDADVVEREAAAAERERLLRDGWHAPRPDCGPIKEMPHSHSYSWGSTGTSTDARPPTGQPCLGCGHRYDPEDDDE